MNHALRHLINALMDAGLSPAPYLEAEDDKMEMVVAKLPKRKITRRKSQPSEKA